MRAILAKADVLAFVVAGAIPVAASAFRAPDVSTVVSVHLNKLWNVVAPGARSKTDAVVRNDGFGGPRGFASTVDRAYSLSAARRLGQANACLIPEPRCVLPR